MSAFGYGPKNALIQRFRPDAQLALPPTAFAEADFVNDRYGIAGVGLVTFADLFDFKRDSVAPRINSAGLLEWVAADTPVFDYDLITHQRRGLRLRPTRENWFANSGNFNGFTSTVSVIIADNVATGPDGATSASSLTPRAVSEIHRATYSQDWQESALYELGCYAKANGYRYLRLAFPVEGFADSGRAACFDLLTGTIVAQDSGVIASITQGPNGYWLCRLSVKANETTTGSASFTINNAATSDTTTFTGDVTKSILFGEKWCTPATDQHLSHGPIKTTGATAFRFSDDLNAKLPQANYDVLLIDESGGSTWLLGRTSTEEGLIAPQRLPNGAKVLARAKWFPQFKPLASYRSASSADTLPSPVFAIRASTAPAAYTATWTFAVGVLPTGATFANASTNRRYYDSTGLLKTASANALRHTYNPTTLAYDGVLVEPAGTNLFSYTDDISNAAHTKMATTVPGTKTTGPDGVANSAWLMLETTANSRHGIDQTFAATEGQVYTFSRYVKAAGRSVVCFNVTDTYFGATTSHAVFDLVTKQVYGGLGTARLIELPNGWFRCEWSITCILTVASTTLSFNTFDSWRTLGPTTSFVGDAAKGVYLYGLQGEERDHATSYIPSPASTKGTRNADVLTMPAGAQGLPDGETAVKATFDDGTSAEKVVTVTGGSFTVNTTWARSVIKRLDIDMKRWNSTVGTGYGYAAKTGTIPALTTVNDQQVLRVNSGNYMPLKGVSLTDEKSFTLLLAFYALGAEMTIYGKEDDPNAVMVKVTATTIQVLIAGELFCSVPRQDDGRMTALLVTMSGTDFRAVDLNDSMNVDFSTVGSASALAAGAPVMFRRTATTELYDGYFGEIALWDGALTEARRDRARREAVERWAGFSVALALRPSSWPTATGMSVNADITGNAAKLIVATDAALTNRVYTSPTPVAPTVTQGQSKTYRTVTLGVPDGTLTPNTVYSYGIEVDGQLDATGGWRCRTLAAPGSAITRVFGLYVCANVVAREVTASMEKIAGHLNDYNLLPGDATYSNLALRAIGAYRDLNLRRHWDNPGGGAIAKSAGLAVMPDDHDKGPNDFDPTVTYSGVPGAVINANSSQTFLETTPLYPYADAQRRVLSYAWDDGQIRFIMIDTRSARSAALATILGDPAKRAGDFDHLGWIKGKLNTAAAAGINRIFLISPTGIPYPSAAAWTAIAPQELTAIYDHIADNPTIPACAWLSGDYHKSFMDDGEMSDRSTGGRCTIPLFLTGAVYHSVSGNLFSPPPKWNGVLTQVATKTRVFHRLTVDPDGHVTDEEWVRSTSSAPVTMFLNKTISTKDTTATVVPAASSVAGGGQLQLKKTWMALSQVRVDWSWSGGGPAGTATWGPNNRYAGIPVPAAPGTYTLTLANPVGCTLPATAIAITVT